MEPSALNTDIVRRLWGHDHTLWKPNATGIADRLGWLNCLEPMLADVDEISQFAQDVAAEGFRTAVLLGMGGSSLAPEVFYNTFGASSRALRLYVLDTTDPYSIRQIEQILDLPRTLFVVSSKSGTTIETRALCDYFWEKLPAGRHFVAITDHGSPLETLAAERGFRRVWLSDPTSGGRYSALTFFGLVPASLIGVDIRRLLDAARVMAETCRQESPENPGLALGVQLGQAVLSGQDKLTLLFPAMIATLGYWVEQMVAESTGKQGKGILPVEGEALGPPDVYGSDRLFVATGSQPRLDPIEAAGHSVIRLPFGDRFQIGAEIFRWEMATAIAAHLLGVNPFDEPNVAESKRATAGILEGQDVAPPDLEPIEAVLSSIRPGDYVAIQAYLPRISAVHEALQTARLQIRNHARVATTLGYGPRFLHVTGQYHKGGPATGVFVQVVGPDDVDLLIPGRPYSFGQLKQAQAAGDLACLRAHSRRVCRVSLEELTAVTTR